MLETPTSRVLLLQSSNNVRRMDDQLHHQKKKQHQLLERKVHIFKTPKFQLYARFITGSNHITVVDHLSRRADPYSEPKIGSESGLGGVVGYHIRLTMLLCSRRTREVGVSSTPSDKLSFLQFFACIFSTLFRGGPVRNVCFPQAPQGCF